MRSGNMITVDMECMILGAGIWDMRRGKYENGNVEVRDRCTIEYMKGEKVIIGIMRFRRLQMWEFGIMRIMRVGGMRIGAM